MKNNNVIIAAVAAGLIFGTGGFFAGTKYQQSKRPQFGNGQMMRSGVQNGQSTNRQNFRPVAGTISASDDTSITVKLPDGSSKIVLLSEKTVINKATEGTKTDLTVGQTVSVFGTENSDKSVTAQNIQIGLPALRGTTN